MQCKAKSENLAQILGYQIWAITDFSQSKLFFSLSVFRLVEAAEKLTLDALDVFRSEGRSTSKGSRRGAPPAARGGPAAVGLPCSLVLVSVRPFGSMTYFPK